ncbi:MAG: hypothetical protein LJE67_09525 [Salaquimonas sp.]|jgi:hypothetical protein|nr:hypothetical protein [Salaquimonas sp.]
MAQRRLLDISLAATLTALVLLVAAVMAAATASPPASQELFETISAPADYAARLVATDAGLRVVLFIDGLFMLAYTTAIGFAALAFRDNNRPAAWLAGCGIVVVMILDALENTTMAGSLDIAGLTGALTLERIATQASISAMKWQIAAATLVATSFVLPSATLLEKLLVWGVRLGLPVAVPLFVYDPFGLRAVGGILLLVSMAGGFVLLAIVLRGRMRQA